MRPPSPLRHEVESESGSEDGDEDQPPATIGRYAADFARSVGSLMSPAKSTSTLPSDAELEAESQRERDRSRREAERILLQEARNRRRVEERVLAMLEDNHGPLSPPTRPTSANQGSPSSQKGDGWWSVAKSRLTPTKDTLTPAQKIIQDTKAKEKAQRKAEKAMAKEEKKVREQQWPAKPNTKYADPAFAALASSASPGPSPVPAQTEDEDEDERPMTPLRPPPRRFSTPASLNMSPSGMGASPANGRESTPLYAQFDDSGTLDVAGTLLLVAKRFEKLEKWTVGHVRALEERMSDVERWLVDKEKERDEHHSKGASSSSSQLEGDVETMREEMAELQGRIGTIGREMARIASSAAAASTSVAASTPPHARNSSTTSSYGTRSIPPFQRTPSTISNGRPMSPPISSVVSHSTGSRTRLPYPTGDYTSPGSSPPATVSSPPTAINSMLNELARADSPTPMNSEYSLPPPKAPALRDSPRATSISPTPRKRYTVALGDPITGRKDDDGPLPGLPINSSSSIETAYFSDMNNSEVDSESDIDFAEETIGKAAFRRVSGKLPPSDSSPSPSPAPTNFRNRRFKAQSAYGFASVSASTSVPNGSNEQNGQMGPPATAPLRLRSQSTENFSVKLVSASASTSNLGLGITADGSSKFMDPYETRKAEREREASAAPPAPKVMTGRKVPLGQLVAFFDKS
jgi:hypothetical protein